MMRKGISETEIRAADKKLVVIAWGIFIAMWVGTIAIQIYSHIDLRGLQYLCVGLILIGLNLVRFLKHIPMSNLSMTVGMLALAGSGLLYFTGELTVLPALVATVAAFLLTEGILRLARRFR